MKALTKEQQAEWAALREEYENAVAVLQELASRAGMFRDDRVSEMQEYYDSKSEKWQDGEKGLAYADWQGEWENLDFPETEEPDFDSASLELPT